MSIRARVSAGGNVTPKRQSAILETFWLSQPGEQGAGGWPMPFSVEDRDAAKHPLTPRTTHSEALPGPYGLGAEEGEAATEPHAPEDE